MACSLYYTMSHFRFCTTFPLEHYSRLSVMTGRVTNCTGTLVLHTSRSLAGHLIGASPGPEPGTLAQQQGFATLGSRSLHYLGAALRCWLAQTQPREGDWSFPASGALSRSVTEIMLPVLSSKTILKLL